MTKGILLLLLIWLMVVVRAIQFPWIGVTGYAGFAVLCPTWNWRWGLPAWDFQKFLAGATLIGWLFTGLRRQRLTPAGNYSLLFFSSYLVLTFLASQGSINPLRSAVYLDITWKIVLMATIASFLLVDAKKLTIFTWVLLLGQGWNAFNINQLYFQQGFINVNSFTWNFLDNNTYCISSVPIMALAFAMMMTSPHAKGRWLAGIIFVLQMHQLMILQSRGTMLGALLMVALGIFFMPKTRHSLQYLVVGVVVGSILAGPSVVEEFTSSFKPQGELDSSAESRFLVWKAGAQIMQDYPLGVGAWAGEMMVPKYYEGDIGGMSNKALHNLFFEVGTGSGIPALICYLLFFGIPWWQHLRLWRSERNRMPSWMRMINLGVLCGVPGYWASSMFSSGALIESPYLLMVLAIASLPVYRAHLDSLNQEDPEDEQALVITPPAQTKPREFATPYNMVATETGSGVKNRNGPKGASHF